MAEIDDNIWLAAFMDMPLYRLEPSAPPTQEAIPIIGNYSNKIVVLHDMAEGLEGKAEQVLLQKIMQAVKVSLADSALINIHEWEHPSMEMLIEQLQPKFIIFFGEEKMPNVQNLPVCYTLGSLQESQVLRAHSLNLINSDVEKKKMLWSALQLMFK